MKVRELIKALESYDSDMEVHFSYNYGDHWRTRVAPKVRSVDEVGVSYSEYHRMPKLDEDSEELAVVLE